MSTTSKKQEEDFINSILLLKFYLNTYEAGNALMYLPMAVELRKLMCEKQDKQLIERVIPDIELYKLHSTELLGNHPSLLVGLQNFMPGSLSFHEHKLPTFNLLFSKKQEKLKLQPWTDQIFFKEGISIRELIKSVADKKAAHADKDYNDTLRHCKNWTFNEIGCHILGVYGISKFIYSLVTTEYSQYLSDK
jgi:hypothetical protein